MQTTRMFKNGNSQAIRIPANMAYELNNTELEIERVGDEIRIRPYRHTLSDVMEIFSRFSENFMEEGRGSHEQSNREKI